MINPFSWIGDIFGAFGSHQATTPGAPQTVNIETLVAALAVAKAFNVNLGNLTPEQMGAVSMLVTAMTGVPIPASAVGAVAGTVAQPK